MSNYGLYETLTPGYIFERIPQEVLIEKYLGFMPPLGIKFSSPFRTDKHPSCTIEEHSNKLVFRDWAADHIYKDVFDLIQHKYKVSFPEAMQMVANDFDLLNGNYEPDDYQWTPRKRPKVDIKVEVQPLRSENLRYLSLFGITPEIAARYRVFGLEAVYLKNRLKYVYDKSDPGIGYYFGINSKGIQKWKLYFYRRQNKKFIGNTARINGYLQLPEQGKFVVITKAMKDVMTLARFRIPAIATQGESILPNEQLIQELRERFSRIFSLYDFDPAGQHSAWILRKNYGIQPIMLTDGSFGTTDFGSKDISDYVRDNGIEKARTLINHALTYYTDEETSRN